MIKWYLTIIMCLFVGIMVAQVNVAPAEIYKNDTIPSVTLNEVVIYPPYNFYDHYKKRDARKLTRLAKNVKKVYPYAKLAGIKLREYEQLLKAANSDLERKKIMKKAEKELEEEFGDDLRSLTFSQGRILLKLIDRETGRASYYLVEELRGKFRAFFYQAFARLFGFDLKDEYDPYGEDIHIEMIVQMIERGRI